MTTQLTKLFSFILANVHDPANFGDTASRILCYSCMSPYLEHQYMYISHLYRRPMSFTPKCDQSRYVSLSLSLSLSLFYFFKKIK
ncbi:unnamed protein product [Brugia pahangi]|uniref:Secreted protein n=1 Tax=Brugia pahangi TaxID=6280 RepID=A0A158PS12_BRUPA|nr:unnamed protein product [Brugia pahangi]